MSQRKFLTIVALGLLGLLIFAMYPHISISTNNENGLRNNQLGSIAPRTFSVATSQTSIILGSTPVTFEVTLTVNASSEVRFFVDDVGLNTTTSTVPAGLSVNINGTLLERISVIGGVPTNSANPLDSLNTGQHMIQFTVSSTTHLGSGSHILPILVASFSDDGKVTDESMEFQVNLIGT